MSKVASLSKDIYTYITTSNNFLYYFSKYAYAPDNWLWYFTGTEIEGRSAFTMSDTIGDSSDYKGLYHHGGTHFYYYPDDPDTLEKQLKEAYMAGCMTTLCPSPSHLLHLTRRPKRHMALYDLVLGPL
ncbi:hypothetical protein TWF102_010236 [Orbilia oligospora]|uniref:Uncharacterized protein n=1 Tax=Orbilia oligospora TaxID=2813651 RepID=A0A7C8N7I1_ORBOL|nr:hypothetical protein TWF102_010236 [Orbilia oligospora]